MVRVTNEAERLTEAIAYTKKQISDLERKMRECDYVEDVNGHVTYMPGCYTYEKREYEIEKLNWELMLNLLTMEAPFRMSDW